LFLFFFPRVFVFVVRIACFVGEMKTTLLSAVVLIALVAFQVEAQTSIELLTPEANAETNNCPCFKWTAVSGTAYNYITVKSVTTGNFIYKNISTGRNVHLACPTYDKSYGDQFVNGEYEWWVTKGTLESEKHRFKVVAQTCLPPKSVNKINNFFPESDYSLVTKSRTGQDNIKPWNPIYEDYFNISLDTSYIVSPPSDGRFFQIKIRESYNEEDHYVFEPIYSNLSLKVRPTTEGDNIVAFWFMFYAETDSLVNVYLTGGDEPDDIPLTCFGSRAGCFANTPSMWQGKWSFFYKKVDLTPGTSNYRIHFDYIRNKTDDTNPETPGAASFMFFFRSLVVGMCSSFSNDDYIPDEWDVDNPPCGRCDSANMSIPVDFKQRCKKCEQQADVCDATGYCIFCDSASKCQNLYSSTCKEDANCSSRLSKSECSSHLDCYWCDIDEKCVFNKEISTCSGCRDLDKERCQQIQETANLCQWCSVDAACKTTEDDVHCSQCGNVNKDVCTLGSTDGACQYCNKKASCLNVSDMCDDTCSEVSAKDVCNDRIDCKWCDSTGKCNETRYGECVKCIDVRTQSSCNEYEGCMWCDVHVCLDKSEGQCPKCEDLPRDECGGIYYCSFCNSTQKCVMKDAECPECAKLSDDKECNKYKGCAYCKSDKACLAYNAGCQECTGMSQAVCMKHPYGCCYVSADRTCYDIDSGNCGSDLELPVVIGIAAGAVVLLLAAILIPTLICCCKKKDDEGVEMNAPGTIVVLPEGQPSMVVAPESMASVTLDPAVSVSMDAGHELGGAAPAATAQVNSAAMSDMQNMMVQQQLLNTMMAQQQMSMMMNPMMVNSMMGMGGMSGMGMSNMGGMNTSMGMSGMNNSMGMDMNSMGMSGGMNMGQTGAIN